MTTLGLASLASVDLLIPQGSDFSAAFQYLVGQPALPVDLTSWSARAQLRTAIGGTVWASFASGAGGAITLDSQGNVVLSIAHAISEAAPWNDYTLGVWDLELVDPTGLVTRLVSGRVTVSHDVTRAS